MDFIFDNIIWFIAAAAGLVQWWKATQEAKEEARRETHEHEYDPAELEEFLEQAERTHPRPAVPPPLPQAAPVPASAPTMRRRSQEAPPLEFQPMEGVSTELERQAKLAEQLKQAKRQRSLDQAPVSASRRKKPVTAESAGTLRGRLQNRRELRQAFVLKEILEKPVGLR